MPGLVSKTFAAVEVGDRRRTPRSIQSAATIAAHPDKPFTQIFDWGQLEGFYRPGDQDSATANAIPTPHREPTRRAMGRRPVVRIPHDATELDYTSHAASTGTGPTGGGRGRGFPQHNSLAVVPTPRRVLGLAYQQVGLRRKAPESETASERRSRDPEPTPWIRGIVAVGRPPTGSRRVGVGDRGADRYEAMAASRHQGHDFLFRAAQDRQVRPAESGEATGKLGTIAGSLASPGEDTVAIPARGGRASREARVRLAARRVRIPAPTATPRRGGQPVMAAWVVRIWEAGPPTGVEPLDRVLVTSAPTETAPRCGSVGTGMRVAGWWRCLTTPRRTGAGGRTAGSRRRSG